MAWRPWKGNGPDGTEPAKGEDLQALEAAAELIEIFGKKGFDTAVQSQQDLERLCIRWVRHLREGEPVPGVGAGRRGVDVERAWPGLVRFMEAQRDQERGHVVQMREQVNATLERVEELKNTLREFAQSLRAVVAGDAKADDEVAGELDALNQLAQSPETDFASLRRRVSHAAQLVQNTIQTRRTRHKEQLEQLGQELVAVKAELATASSEAQKDGLTELYNRKTLDAQLDRTVTLCQMTGRPTCLLMVDLDNFKHINDAYGHQAGDEALQALSKVLSTVVLRKSDFVARYGGDEFTVILNNCRLSAGQFIADRLLTAVRGIRVRSDRGVFGITVSMGIAELGPRETREDWMKRADLNLLSAKRAGRDRVH